MARQMTMYDVGEDVIVFDPAFDPTAQYGVVTDVHGSEEISVAFERDPFDWENDESRTIGCHPVQIVSADADEWELQQFIGEANDWPSP